MGGKRTKHKCPVPNCPKEYVVHLPHHLRDFHKLRNEEAVQAISQFDLRKPRKRKNAESSREHKRRVCPVDGCNAIVKRIHNHLHGKHKLMWDDTQYQAYLKEKLHKLPETFEEEVISISSGSISEDSMPEKRSKITKVEPVFEEEIGEEKVGKTDNGMDDEPATPLKQLWAQTFGGKRWSFWWIFWWWQPTQRRQSFREKTKGCSAVDSCKPPIIRKGEISHRATYQYPYLQGLWFWFHHKACDDQWNFDWPWLRFTWKFRLSGRGSMKKNLANLDDSFREDHGQILQHTAERKEWCQNSGAVTHSFMQQLSPRGQCIKCWREHYWCLFKVQVEWRTANGSKHCF